MLEIAVEIDEATSGVPVDYQYGMDVGSAAFAYRAWCFAVLGRSKEARRDRDILLQRLERTKHVFTRARGLNWCSLISAALGDWKESKMCAARAIVLAGEYGLKLVASLGTAMEGIANAAITEDDDALTEARAGIAEYGQTGARVQVPFMLCLIAETAVRANKCLIAAEAIAEATFLVHQTGERHVALKLLELGERLAGATAK